MVCQMMDVWGFQIAVGVDSVLVVLCANVAIVRTLRALHLFQEKKSYVDPPGKTLVRATSRVVKGRPS